MTPRSSSNLSRWLAQWHGQPLKIAGIYALVSGVWIITSDTIIQHLAPDENTAHMINIIKGWAFVAITTGMLWWLVRRLLIRIGNSETDLQSSEEQARAIVNGVSDAIFIHDAQTGAILEVNETACRMFGYTRDEFLHINVEDLSSGVAPYTQENAVMFTEMSRHEKQEPVEWHSRHRDGTLFWTEVIAQPVEVANQTRVLVTGRNIDKRKHAAEQLRKLSQAVEQNPVSITVVNTDGDIEYVNPANSNLTGYSAEELIGKNRSFLKPEHIATEKFEHMLRTIYQGREWRGEFKNRKKNGDPYWEMATASAITDDSGEITHFLIVKEDITERKHAEEKLKQQETLLAETGEIANVGGWEFDPTTGLGSSSSEVARIFGFDPSMNLDAASSLDFFHGESRNKLETALAAAIKDGTPYDLELELVSAKGDKKWIRAICRPILENGQVIRVRGTLQEITDRKRADQERQESRARLRALLARLQKALEDERTRISREVHDVLGQLLTGIKMEVTWCERRLPRIEDAELRHEFTQKLTGINTLSDSMLDSVQKISRDLRPSLLDDLGLIAALQFEARQFTKRTGIPCEITSTLAFVELPPDHTTQVFRIFQEILTNVARHSHASQVSIALLRQHDELTLTVEDNGCGISLQAQQDANSLGLLGMAERAALIGGRIRFHGAPGAGTKVDLTVPEMIATNSTT